MKPPQLLIVLFLAALASPAYAIVVQSGDIPLTHSQSNPFSTTFAGEWNLPKYNDPARTLTSLRLIIDFRFGGHWAETNPFEPGYNGAPETYQARAALWFTGNGVLRDGNDSWWADSKQIGVSGPEFTLKPYQLATWSTTASLTINALFTNPSDLAHFVGEGTTLFRPGGSIYALSMFVGGGGGASVNATVIYGVPEYNHTLALLAGTMLTLGIVRRFANSRRTYDEARR